jgi:ferredoxin
MYVILTSKTGIFRTEGDAGVKPVEAWAYSFYGRLRARFVIATIEGDCRITVTEEEAPFVVNRIPSKFLQKFDTLGAARHEIEHLTHFQDPQVLLEQVALEAVAPPAEAPAPDKLTVTFITNEGKQAQAPLNSNLLRVSLREKGGIPFKCGGGLCGTCKCRIETGLEHTDEVKPKERKHLSDDDLRQGYRMACQTFLKGDISVSWVAKSVAV